MDLLCFTLLLGLDNSKTRPVAWLYPIYRHVGEWVFQVGGQMTEGKREEKERGKEREKGKKRG